MESVYRLTAQFPDWLLAHPIFAVVVGVVILAMLGIGVIIAKWG